MILAKKVCLKMKISVAVLVVSFCGSAWSFQPATLVRKSTALSGFDLSGNSWKPDSEKMGSTDTGDYFPEGYDPNEIAFTEGWQGSQELLTDKDRGGPQLYVWKLDCRGLYSSSKLASRRDEKPLTRFCFCRTCIGLALKILVPTP